jgi:hypothetical protein
MKILLTTSVFIGILFLTNSGYANETKTSQIFLIPHAPLVIEPVVERDWNYRGSPWGNSGTKPWLWAPNDFTVPTRP